MGKTNWTRVFLGGLLAGVVLNIFYFACLGVYSQINQFSDIRIASFFITGMTAIWLYSAIRPRYGAGPKTAIIAGIAFVVIYVLLPDAVTMEIMYRTKEVVINGIIFLAMYVPATLIGAYVYKEQE